MASPYPPPGLSRPAPPPTFREKVNRFWLRVTEGLELNQLWSQFEKDARASYRLYSKDLADRPENQSGWRRVLHVAKPSFWAVLDKLSPPRRLFLLLALLLLTFNP